MESLLDLPVETRGVYGDICLEGAVTFSTGLSRVNVDTSPKKKLEVLGLTEFHLGLNNHLSPNPTPRELREQTLESEGRVVWFRPRTVFPRYLEKPPDPSVYLREESCCKFLIILCTLLFPLFNTVLSTVL